jgi:carboxymethylenebutenolidase
MVNEQTVDKQAVQATPNLTPAQEALQALWDEHLRHEFVTQNVEDALATMVEDAYVNDIPVMTGGVGKPALREFYSKYGIPQIPPDMELIPISRTIGTEGKRVEVALVAIVQFRDGKLAHEHIYWDQASVLVQLGLLDPGTLPVVGADSARKVLDPSLPSNALIDRASDRD